VKEGNVGGALLDAAGVVADTVAAVVPGAPGGAGTAIKAGRAADAAVDVGQKVVRGALETAQQGGKHGGFLRNFAGRPRQEIEKGIASLEKRIVEHRAKIADPERFIPNPAKLDPRQQKALVERKWPGDIQRQQEQLEILK
jgi:hypothetical protein